MPTRKAHSSAYARISAIVVTVYRAGPPGWLNSEQRHFKMGSTKHSAFSVAHISRKPRGITFVPHAR